MSRLVTTKETVVLGGTVEDGVEWRLQRLVEVTGSDRKVGK